MRGPCLSPTALLCSELVDEWGKLEHHAGVAKASSRAHMLTKVMRTRDSRASCEAYSQVREDVGLDAGRVRPGFAAIPAAIGYQIIQDPVILRRRHGP